MPSTETTDNLNRVLTILERSFPQYLKFARPYIPPGREDVMRTIFEIVAGQDALAERVSAMVFEAGDLPDDGKFPIEFADTHDLSIDFLIREAIDCQKQDIADLKECVAALRISPAAQMLAEEALGQAKGHLESLEELAKPVAPSKPNAAPVSKEAKNIPVPSP
jgi:hypothetical protein